MPVRSAGTLRLLAASARHRPAPFAAAARPLLPAEPAGPHRHLHRQLGADVSLLFSPPSRTHGLPSGHTDDHLHQVSFFFALLVS